jgi:hypothetical protein
MGSPAIAMTRKTPTPTSRWRRRRREMYLDAQKILADFGYLPYLRDQVGGVKLKGGLLHSCSRKIKYKNEYLYMRRRDRKGLFTFTFNFFTSL